MQMKDQAAIVTGGASGLGAATARKLAADDLPTVAAIVAAKKFVGSEIDARVRMRTDDERRVPIPSQRIFIAANLRLNSHAFARALVIRPQVLLLDEPFSALDRNLRASMQVELKEIQRKLGVTTIFVTHDMSLVSHFSDRLAVMYAGQVVEIGPTREVFADPKHPYTIGLMRSFPSISGPRQPLAGIAGSPPDLGHLPSGCRFHPRCPQAFERCPNEEPDFYARGQDLVRCFLYAPAAHK